MSYHDRSRADLAHPQPDLVRLLEPAGLHHLGHLVQLLAFGGGPGRVRGALHEFRPHRPQGGDPAHLGQLAQVFDPGLGQEDPIADQNHLFEPEAPAQQSIEAEAALDGFYAIRTSVPAEEMEAAEVVRDAATATPPSPIPEKWSVDGRRCIALR